MSKLQVKIDGEWQDFCKAVDKPLVYLEQEEICKTKILTDIRDYLNGLLAEWNGADVHFERISLVENQLENLTEYAEKLGVEL